MGILQSFTFGTDKVRAYCGILFVVLFILMISVAIIYRGEKVSTFETVGKFSYLSAHQSKYGVSIKAYVEIEQVDSLISISLPNNVRPLKGSAIKLRCSKYESGSIQCSFQGVANSP